MGSAAASSKESESGIGTAFSAGTATYSAFDPCRFVPIIEGGLVPQSGFTTTRSPTLTPSTPSPSAATSPAQSPPRMRGISSGATFVPRSPARV